MTSERDWKSNMLRILSRYTVISLQPFRAC